MAPSQVPEDATLLETFRACFPACLGSELAEPPDVPEEFAGLTPDTMVEKWKALDLPYLDQWRMIWRLVACGDATAYAFVREDMLPRSRVEQCSEEERALLGLAAIIGGHPSLYSNCRSPWTRPAGDPYLSHKAKLQLDMAWDRHAVGAALVYGQEAWLETWWTNKGGQAQTFGRDIPHALTLWGKADQQIFGHPPLLDRLIRIHWADRWHSEITRKGWTLSRASTQAAQSGQITASQLATLVEQGQAVWTPELSLEDRKALVLEVEAAWHAAVVSHDGVVEQALRPWVSSPALERGFVTACVAGDLPLAQALKEPTTIQAWHRVIQALIEKGPTLDQATHGPILALVLTPEVPWLNTTLLINAAIKGAPWLVEAILPYSNPAHDRANALREAIKAKRWAIADRLRPLSEAPSEKRARWDRFFGKGGLSYKFDLAVAQQALEELGPLQVGMDLVANQARGLLQKMLPLLPAQARSQVAMFALRESLAADPWMGGVGDVLVAASRALTDPSQVHGWPRRCDVAKHGELLSEAMVAFMTAVERRLLLAARPVTSGSRPRVRS